MCVETIQLSKVSSERDAYEVAEYLKGLPFVDHARCNFLRNEIMIEYDETVVDHDRILDELAFAGCRAEERVSSGPIARLRRSVGV